MNFSRKILLLSILLLSGPVIFAQSESNIDNKILYRKERSGFIMVHSGGFGVGYRSGKHKTYFRKFMWEVEGLNIKHPKEHKTQSYYENSKNFIYGKLNSFFAVRGGVGQQHILNGKPYWGGVEVRLFYFGGLSLGITKPIYLNIVKFDETTGQSYLSLERFDPNIHSVYDIYGKASFFKGFNKIGVYPGIYTKVGLSFEYGAEDTFLKALECGVFADCFYKNVPIMAFQKNQFLFANVYLSLHFGVRKN
ncbi:MAG TPA: hypothetical protein PLI16_09175 [Bacteroidales bacterium]|nr:hypothetical protein [Bacteroidales bacterium]HOH84768.1 hypothetical protein [Bacteroidales bacterium]HPB24465.1 hypothetical protein [Bacteroidales bacterium]HPI29268.1 hypothetical protein [Bacteroidales bacterium]HQN15050.1 hypothetical protein [Bacteroidales bacterium]